jgi:hypothetical protein
MLRVLCGGDVIRSEVSMNINNPGASPHEGLQARDGQARAAHSVAYDMRLQVRWGDISCNLRIADKSTKLVPWP